MDSSLSRSGSFYEGDVSMVAPSRSAMTVGLPDQLSQGSVFVKFEDETACQLIEVIEKVLRDNEIPAARAEAVVRMLDGSAPAQAFLGDVMNLVAKFTVSRLQFSKSK